MTAMIQTEQFARATETQHAFLNLSPQQVTTHPAVIGKFYGDRKNFFEGWWRFIEFNQHQIDVINESSGKIIMLDGTKYLFRLFEYYKDVQKIAGISFYSVDIDRDITDPRILDYIRTRIRWPY